jgi:hypothetical protein
LQPRHLRLRSVLRDLLWLWFPRRLLPALGRLLLRRGPPLLGFLRLLPALGRLLLRRGPPLLGFLRRPSALEHLPLPDRPRFELLASAFPQPPAQQLRAVLGRLLLPTPPLLVLAQLPLLRFRAVLGHRLGLSPHPRHRLRQSRLLQPLLLHFRAGRLAYHQQRLPLHQTLLRLWGGANSTQRKRDRGTNPRRRSIVRTGQLRAAQTPASMALVRHRPNNSPRPLRGRSPASRRERWETAPRQPTPLLPLCLSRDT